MAKMGAGGAKQVEAVLAGLGEGLLVAEDNPVSVIVQAAQRDNAATLGHVARARYRKRLGIDEDSRSFIFCQKTGRAPVVKIFGSASINIKRRGIGFTGLAQNDANQVVRAALVIGGLHFRRDFVIGLGQHVFQLHLLGIVTKSLKWNDFSHAQNSV